MLPRPLHFETHDAQIASEKKMKKKIDAENVNKFRLAEIQNQSAERENGLVDRLQWIFDEKTLKFAIVSSAFPLVLFTREYVEEINETLQHLKLQIPVGEGIPRSIYTIFETGYCTVKVTDSISKKRIVEKIKSLTYQGIPLMATPIKRLPIIRCMAIIPGQILDNSTILSSINHQNESVDTCRWIIFNKTQSENDFSVFFEVDAVSAHEIYSLNRMINFRGGQIQFEFEQMINQAVDDRE